MNPAKLAKTTRLTRHTYGDDGVFGKRNIVSVSFAATDLGKAAAANATFFGAALTTGVITPTARLSAARNVTITGVSGTGNVIIAGRNVEGAVISETLTINSTTLVTGNKAFASVTSITVPASASVNVGTGSKFGVGARDISASSIKVLVIPATGAATLEDASASAVGAAIENNTVTLTTTPDGVKQFRVYALTYNWHVDPTNGNPVYAV